VGDWPRHKDKRLCVPVMVKDFGEKGKGLVASRDFKIGDLIMKETAVISSTEQINLFPTDVRNYGAEICKQLQLLPEDVRAEFFELSASKELPEKLADPNYAMVPENLMRVVAIFVNNRIGNKIYLSMSLINHSCDENANWDKLTNDGLKEELRAIKDIKMGEEITSTYLTNFQLLTENKQSRRKWLADNWHFLCQCTRCLGPEDEELSVLKGEIKGLLPVRKTPSSLEDWKSQARDHERLVDAILFIVNKPSSAFWFEFKTLASYGHMSRCPELVEKGMRLFEESTAIGKFASHLMEFEKQKKRLESWKPNFQAMGYPTYEEMIDFLSLPS